jgi:tetratricopeptide (TPR) repeat protein
MQRFGWLGWLCLFLGLAASTARAENDPNVERARSHVKAAIAYYDEARYEDAAREMDAAYRLKPLPDLQYNLAQCYERLNRLPDAVAAYQRYLDGKPGSDDRQEILARVKNLEERIAQAKAGEQAVPPPPPPVEKVVLKTVVVYKEMPPPPGRGVRIAAWAVGAVAVAALASGIAFSVLAKQDADAVTAGGNQHLPVPFEGNPADTQQAGQTDRIVAGVSFGIAALAAGGAVGLYLLGNHIDKEAAKLAEAAPRRGVRFALVPSVGRSGGGFALAGTWGGF